jgi:hypothetical protein
VEEQHYLMKLFRRFPERQVEIIVVGGRQYRANSYLIEVIGDFMMFRDVNDNLALTMLRLENVVSIQQREREEK